MVEESDQKLGESIHKSFRVTAAVREPIAVEQWKLLPPTTNSREPLTLTFPRPWDWALLLNTITVTLEDSQQVSGRITIDEGERRWSFAPAALWSAGSYYVRIAPSLEDVCGNSVIGAFDRPLRLASDSVNETPSWSRPFRLT